MISSNVYQSIPIRHHMMNRCVEIAELMTMFSCNCQVVHATSDDTVKRRVECADDIPAQVCIESMLANANSERGMICGIR